MFELCVAQLEAELCVREGEEAFYLYELMDYEPQFPSQGDFRAAAERCSDVRKSSPVFGVMFGVRI